MKVYLVSQSRPFEKTHDLGALAASCSAIDGSFREIFELAESLTIYAVTVRYPGPHEPTRAEVAAALGAMEAIQ